MTLDPIKRLKQLELADLRRQEREAKRERAAIRKTERRERRRELWPRWVAFWEVAARHLKTAGIVVGSTVAVISGGVALYKYASAAWRVVTWRSHADRDVGQAAEPPSSGVATTALDFVTKHPPDAGTTK